MDFTAREGVLGADRVDMHWRGARGRGASASLSLLRPLLPDLEGERGAGE
jgi:hypothetical protein